jgi:hypothetical protein
MRFWKPVEVPATLKHVLDKTTCDLCGSVINSERGDAEEVEVKHRTGSSYPEGGSGQEVRVDMCGDCFDDKLVPWLRAQGADPRIEDWEW